MRMSFTGWSVCILLKICSNVYHTELFFIFAHRMSCFIFSIRPNYYVYNVESYKCIFVLQVIVLFFFKQITLALISFFNLIQWHSYLIVQILLVAVVNSNECKYIGLWIILLHVFYCALFISTITKPTLILDAFDSHLV